MHRFYITVVLAMRNLRLHKLRVLLDHPRPDLRRGVGDRHAGDRRRGQPRSPAPDRRARGHQRDHPQHEAPDDVNPSKQQNNDSFIFKFGVTYEDFQRIMSTSHVVGATPLREYRKKVRHLEREIEARIVGVNPDFLKLTGQHMEDGRFLTDTDLFYCGQRRRARAPRPPCKLFPYGDPVGKTVRIGEDHYFQVVGVTSYKAPSAGTGSSLAAQDFNKDVYIPLTTDRARFGEVIENQKQGNFTAERIELSQITVTVDSMENVKRTAESLESMLRQFHPKNDYAITVPLELLEKAEATQRSSTWSWARSPASRSWSAGSGS